MFNPFDVLLQKHFWIAMINKNIIRDLFGKQSGGRTRWVGSNPPPGSFIMAECIGQVCPHKGWLLCSIMQWAHPLCRRCCCVVATFRFRFVEGSSGMGDGPQVALNSGTSLPSNPWRCIYSNSNQQYLLLFRGAAFVLFASNFQLPLRIPTMVICWNFEAESSPWYNIR